VATAASMPTDLARNVPLDQLHYGHEILYFKVLAEQLSELMPVVYFNPAGPADARSPN
jgi:malate dehydrogenase (oxaloacetate-decarboxylating)